MTRDYTIKWSEKIENLTPEERTWIAQQDNFPASVINPEDGVYFLWFRANDFEELETLDVTVKAVMAFFRKFRREEVFYLTWSDSALQAGCSVFGGGLVRVTHNTIYRLSTQDKRKEMQQKDREYKLLEAYRAGELEWPV